MMKPFNPQSQKRFQESLASLFVPLRDFKAQKYSLLFIKSSSDEGVIRNGGRNGARFAPQSFLSYFKKLTQNEQTKSYCFAEIEVAGAAQEKTHFHEAQRIETKKIAEQLKNPEMRICHLGGGHDHIYPLLMALAESQKKIVVINIDAHADTRTDESFHSGTPFRQFSSDFKGEFHLFQIGLHPFANSFSTLSNLEKGTQAILWKKELDSPEKVTAFFHKIKAVTNEDAVVVFSLDADALAANCVPGVSAVNGDGLDPDELRFLWEKYRSLHLKHAPILGIYELNPLFDTISMVSMRTLGNFVFETLEK